MRPSTVLRLARAALAALAVTTVPALAQAEPIALVGAYPQRTQADGAASTRLPRADDDLAGDAGIDRADCESAERWSWAFTLPALPSGVTFATLDVWAGAEAGSCADPAVRAGSAGAGPSPRCWKVASFAAAAVANRATVSFASSDVIEAAFRQQNVGDASPPTKAAICEPAVDMQPTRVFLHFLLMDAAGQAIGGAASNPYESYFQTTYDLRGPDAPAAPTFSAGPLIVALDWPAPSASDQDFAGYAVYCLPAGAAVSPAAPGEDGGALGCAGASGTAAPDLPTAADEAFRCATSITHAATLYGLQPGTSYAIQLASLDRYGNTGPLSKPACGVSISGPLDYQPTPSSNGACVLGASSAPLQGELAVLAGFLALPLLARARRRASAR